MIIPQGSEPKAVRIATIVRATGQTAPGSGTTFENVAGRIDEKMIRDVAPSTQAHVVILDVAHDGLGILKACGVITCPGGVMNNSAAETAHLGDAAIRSARPPTGTGADIRLWTLPGFRREGNKRPRRRQNSDGVLTFETSVHDRFMLGALLKGCCHRKRMGRRTTIPLLR